jgi:hypothetical protein
MESADAPKEWKYIRGDTAGLTAAIESSLNATPALGAAELPQSAKLPHCAAASVLEFEGQPAIQSRS